MKSSLNFPDLSTPSVMGILNITPDSFYDGGRNEKDSDYMRNAAIMVDEGAAILDIGGASTRPGAVEISAEEEWKRIKNALISLRKKFPAICISVDTFHSTVARQAIEHGADMINDISGGTFDPAMASVIAEADVPLVIMHIKGRPGNMQNDPHYDNVFDEVEAYFTERTASLRSKGAHRLILDPGFGFGKSLEHNYSLLKQLSDFKKAGFPLMVGLSRKSMINKVLKTSPAEALNGTSVLNTIALLNGADILRVHDVKEAIEVVRIFDQLV